MHVMMTRDRAQRLGLAGGTLAIAAFLLSACGSASPVADITVGGKSGLPTQDQYMVLTPAGRVPLRANVPLDISGNLDANVSIVPREGRWSRLAEVQLTQPANGNAPVDGATVLATASMRGMPQMICTGSAIPEGSGRYGIPMQFGMPGAWQMIIQVLRGDDAGRLTLEVDLPQAG